jgi:hypothetical protein
MKVLPQKFEGAVLLVLLIYGFMNYAIVMGSGALIYKPSFIKIDSTKI